MSLVQKKWCLGNTVLPLETRTFDYVDFHHLLPESDGDECSFLLLSLKATGDCQWIDKYFERPRGWWRSSGRAMPLMQEILKAFPSGGRQKVAAYTSKTVVPIKVRGKAIVVLNDRRSLALAFDEQDPNWENLQWFLEEMKKDLPAKTKRISSKGPKQHAPVDREEEDDIIQEALSNLKNHQKCSKAWFMSSRNSIKVVTTDKRHKLFFVKDLRKRRKKALERLDDQSWDSVRSSFLDACSQAVVFLQQEPEGAASSSCPRVPPVEEDSQEEQGDGSQEEQESEEGEDDEGDP